MKGRGGGLGGGEEASSEKTEKTGDEEAMVSMAKHH